MCASMNGHEGVVSMLLSAGARVDIQDDAVSSTNVMLALSIYFCSYYICYLKLFIEYLICMHVHIAIFIGITACT